MRVLVACEFSGRVREAFRQKGHDAYSCDLLPAADKSVYHFQDDVCNVLNDNWDLMIAHPPCTHLAVSGAHLFQYKVTEQAAALDFVRTLLDAAIPKIALENPIGVISTYIRKPDQIIQPYDFGEDASKRTCIWLKNLPKLKKTESIPAKFASRCGHARWHQGAGYFCPVCGVTAEKLVWGNQTPSGQNNLGPSEDRWKLRSLTYQGIANAMAAQWG
jgi:hypothetical protein